MCHTVLQDTITSLWVCGFACYALIEELILVN